MIGVGAPIARPVVRDPGRFQTHFMRRSPGPASQGGGTGAKPAACENKKGTSSTEIHVYSSLPRQGTNTEQTNTLASCSHC